MMVMVVCLLRIRVIKFIGVIRQLDGQALRISTREKPSPFICARKARKMLLFAAACFPGEVKTTRLR